MCFLEFWKFGEVRSDAKAVRLRLLFLVLVSYEASSRLSGPENRNLLKPSSQEPSKIKRKHLTSFVRYVTGENCFFWKGFFLFFACYDLSMAKQVLKPFRFWRVQVSNWSARTISLQTCRDVSFASKCRNWIKKRAQWSKLKITDQKHAQWSKGERN